MGTAVSGRCGLGCWSDVSQAGGAHRGLRAEMCIDSKACHHQALKTAGLSRVLQS